MLTLHLLNESKFLTTAFVLKRASRSRRHNLYRKIYGFDLLPASLRPWRMAIIARKNKMLIISARSSATSRRRARIWSRTPSRQAGLRVSPAALLRAVLTRRQEPRAIRPAESCVADLVGEPPPRAQVLAHVRLLCYRRLVGLALLLHALEVRALVVVASVDERQDDS
ncbi:hypothetical protein T492DRAFT_1103316, partial [Pavlovales sp. CCMP2436]